MNRRTTGLTVVFSLLLLVTAAGIIYHYVTGYDYPASAVNAYELNVLGDLYEFCFVVPVSLVALWLMRRESPWGAVLVAGVAANITYNYAMIVTGLQNFWTLLWTVKLALAGTSLCLTWSHLPAAVGRPAKPRLAMAGYLAFILLIFGKMMAQRLLASATGTTVGMTMAAAGTPADWTDPTLRDPIIFFGYATPVIIAAVLGLWRGTDWGARAAALSSAFLVSIITAVLFTGPFKEFLLEGTVSSAMWMMSAIMTVASIPAFFSLAWLVKGERRHAAQRAAA